MPATTLTCVGAGGAIAEGRESRGGGALVAPATKVRVGERSMRAEGGAGLPSCQGTRWSWVADAGGEAKRWRGGGASALTALAGQARGAAGQQVGQMDANKQATENDGRRDATSQKASPAGRNYTSACRCQQPTAGARRRWRRPVESRYTSGADASPRRVPALRQGGPIGLRLHSAAAHRLRSRRCDLLRRVGERARRCREDVRESVG